MNFTDPRMDPRFYMMQQYHQPQPGYGAPPPPPPPPPQRKQGQDEEIAMNLLKLNKNNSESTPGLAGGDQNQPPPSAGGGPSEEEMYRHNMHAQQRHHHQAAAFMHGGGIPGGGMYPPMGSVYGYPSMGFDRQMLAAAVSRDRPPHAPPPAMMEEPQIVLTDVSFTDLLGDSTLVSLKDRDLIPDSLFIALAQLKPCKLQQADRVGCYKTREIGFVGMCCKHCGGQPGFGRYFPNSVRSLAQTTTSQTILKHIGGKCRFCPPTIRKAVLELQRQQAHKEGLASNRPRYGSRKIFFQRMWARLHGKNQPDEIGDEADDTKDDEDVDNTTLAVKEEDTTVKVDSKSQEKDEKLLTEEAEKSGDGDDEKNMEAVAV
ncbi:hypothetical protein IV203_016643 [Nitzschia inconspicua]|uniref:Uncharacterized protein n=1 Tax=Nitzschia inconspicua TaxID=303405 RepID=A0A9K3PHV9_9STRA|nr:hypothetical protein IV203_016643 [Nitzschia inconspicua]